MTRKSIHEQISGPARRGPDGASELQRLGRGEIEAAITNMRERSESRNRIAVMLAP